MEVIRDTRMYVVSGHADGRYNRPKFQMQMERRRCLGDRSVVAHSKSIIV